MRLADASSLFFAITINPKSELDTVGTPQDDFMKAEAQ